MKKFVFRRMVKDELKFFIGIRNECANFLHNNNTFTIDEANEWFDRTKPVYYITNYQGVDVGYFRITNIESDQFSIGFDLHKDWRGKKLSYDAYIQMMKQLFEEYEIINLEVLETNVVAHNLYKKLGFVETSRYKMGKDRNEIDSIVMMMTKENFNKIFNI